MIFICLVTLPCKVNCTRGPARLLHSILTSSPARRIALGALLLISALTATAQAAGLDLSGYRGKVVYLDFWASWCTPCRRSFPWLDELSSRYARRNLVVIGVNVDTDHALAEKFLSSNWVSFPILFDPQGDLATRFKIGGMPSAVLIDRDGRVRFQHVGFSEKKEEEYEAHVQSLLDETAH